MAAEVLNMNILTIKYHWCKLKDLCFKTATKPYTQRWGQGKKKYNKNKGGQHEKILHLFGFTVPGECC